MAILEKKYFNDHLEVIHLVEEKFDGQRLDLFVQTYLDTFSRELIKKKIKLNEVKIKNRMSVHRPSTILHSNDVVTILFFKSSYEDEYWQEKKLNLNLVPEMVYEDSDLIVISKPAFMSTHPTGRHIFNCATVYFEKKYNQTIHSLHRIDRETSGILMLGKNPKTANEMMLNFENDSVKKCYLFISLVQNDCKKLIQFEAKERLGSEELGLKRVYINAYPEHSREGKEAHTNFKILKYFDKYAIGLAFPITGRQHQIRVHAKENGLPLLGDKLYLGSYEMFQRFKDQIATSEDYQLMELPRHALHAIALEIPYKKSKQLFQTKIPKDFLEWLSKFNTIDSNLLELQINEELKNYFVDNKCH